MGQNLALNFESKGFSVAVYNRTTARTDDFIEGPAKGRNVLGTHSIASLVEALESPRKVFLMVKAGEPVDDFIGQLLPHLHKGDLIIDGGNSYFKDTERRSESLASREVLYIGTGVSGGEEGALKGPCIMPGGQAEAYALVAGLLTKAAAQVDDGPCCSYIGPAGAGHFVKMVHNGIEYGIMQCIAETYDAMSQILGMSATEIGEAMTDWQTGELNGYLMEITINALAMKDEDTGKPLVDVILDKAGQKGTGKWTSQTALDVGVAIPTIDTAVASRIMSAFKDERVAASKLLNGPKPPKEQKATMVQNLRDGLYCSMISTYAQGFSLLTHASAEFGYGLNMPEIARIWKGGCIIRSRLLDKFRAAFQEKKDLVNILVAPEFVEIMNKRQASWRKGVGAAVAAGVPCLSLGASLAYWDGYRAARMPQNLTQAQRDYFGAHTYQRTDKPGTFHTIWPDTEQ